MSAPKIYYLNSWGVKSLKINGIDYTNTEIIGDEETNAAESILPPRIDGKYYLEFEADLSWSHFEVFGRN